MGYLAGRSDGPFPLEYRNNMSHVRKLEARISAGLPPPHPNFGLFKCCKKMPRGAEKGCFQCPLWPVAKDSLGVCCHASGGQCEPCQAREGDAERWAEAEKRM